jgi:hypothetical protein
MEGAIITIGFFQLVLILMFIQLVGDTRALRVKLDTRNPKVWLERYRKDRAFNRNKEALYSLQEYVWVSMKKSGSNYDDLKNKWEKDFILLGSKFPEKS